MEYAVDWEQTKHRVYAFCVQVLSSFCDVGLAMFEDLWRMLISIIAYV